MTTVALRVETSLYPNVKTSDGIEWVKEDGDFFFLYRMKKKNNLSARKPSNYTNSVFSHI